MILKLEEVAWAVNIRIGHSDAHVNDDAYFGYGNSRQYMNLTFNNHTIQL